MNSITFHFSSILGTFCCPYCCITWPFPTSHLLSLFVYNPPNLHFQTFAMSRLVDQGEGWFQVKQTGRRLRFVPKPTNNDGIPSPNPVHPNPNPTLSVDELATYHELVTKDLQSSPWWQEVLQTLQSVADKSGGLPSIKKAVCLGPGPYEPRNCSSTARKTAHIQTAVFCYLVEYFGAY